MLSYTYLFLQSLSGEQVTLISLVVWKEVCQREHEVSFDWHTYLFQIKMYQKVYLKL